MNASDVFQGDALSEGVRVPVMVLGWLTCVSGVFGNILIITTLLSQPNLRSLHNLYIGNLAMADLLISAYAEPFWLLDLTTGSQPVVNTAHCICNSYVLCWGFSASILTLVTISLNRYLHVCHYPLFVTLFTRQRTLVLCLLTWVLSVFLCLPSLLSLRRNSTGYDPKFRICASTTAESGSYSTWYTSVMLMLPSVIVGVTNAAIFRHWRRSRSALNKWRVGTPAAAATAAAVAGSVLGGDSRISSGQMVERSEVEADLEKSDEGGMLVVPAKQDLNVVPPVGAKLHEHGDSNATAGARSESRVVSDHELSHPGEKEDKRIFDVDRSAVQPKGKHASEVPILPCTGADLPGEHCARLPALETPDFNCTRESRGKVCFSKNLHVSPSDTPKTTPRLKRKWVDSARHRFSPSDIALIRSLLTVFVSCVILYLPLAVANILDIYRPVSAEVGIWTIACGFLNHSINWIVYGLMNKTFREGYVRQVVLCCRKDGMRL